MSTMYYNGDYEGSCDPMKEGNEGIWFEEEDPTSEYYRPECCEHVYISLARGYFDNLDVNDDEYDFEYDADDDYEYDDDDEYYEYENQEKNNDEGEEKAES
jgi:hypothetical protein